MREKYIRHRA